jgi:hypothetical protein
VASSAKCIGTCATQLEIAPVRMTSPSVPVDMRHRVPCEPQPVLRRRRRLVDPSARRQLGVVPGIRLSWASTSEPGSSSGSRCPNTVNRGAPSSGHHRVAREARGPRCTLQPPGTRTCKGYDVGPIYDRCEARDVRPIIPLRQTIGVARGGSQAAHVRTWRRAVRRDRLRPQGHKVALSHGRMQARVTVGQGEPPAPADPAKRRASPPCTVAAP